MTDLNSWLLSADYPRIDEAYESRTHLSSDELLIVAISKLMLNQPQASKSIFLGIADDLEGIDNKIVNSNLGLYFLILGNHQLSETSLHNALGEEEQDFATYARLGALALSQGHYAESADYYRQSVALKPDNASCHSNLAGIYSRLQEFERALNHYDIARSIDRDHVQANEGFEKTLRTLGRGDEYIDELYVDREASPNSLSALIRLANALSSYDKPTMALSELRKHLLNPEQFDAPESDESEIKDACDTRSGQIAIRQRMIPLQQNLNRHGAVLMVINQLRELGHKIQPALMTVEIEAYLEVGKTEKGEELLEEYLPNVDAVTATLLKSKIYEHKEQYEEAEAILAAYLSHQQNVELDLRLAQVKVWRGDLSGAQAIYRKNMKARPNVMTLYINAGGKDIDEAELAAQEKSMSNPLIPKGIRIAGGHALSEIYEKNGNYARAWELLTEANDLSNSDIVWKTKAREQLVARLKKTFSSTFVEEHTYSPKTELTPVFIVGMPRSGTTLLEKILAQNEDIFGAGELPTIPQISRLLKRVTQSEGVYPMNMRKFTEYIQSHATRYYLRATEELREDAKYIVDKMPHNFLHVGLIFVIFPHAKVINLIRDPRDIAISNYQQNFKAKFSGLGYSCSMSLIAHELNQYYEITDYWSGLFSDRILNVKYEELVEDPTAEGQRIMAYVGSSWDDKNLSFHESKEVVRTASVTQVRQPIYQTSKKKWKRYEPFIGDFLSALRPELLSRYDD